MTYTTDQIRSLWLDFWASKNHAIIPSASVLPDNDPTALFHNSGMHPLVPYLMGNPHPKGKRLADAQKCIRTIDIDEVGDNTHLTFFEMLGNWSLGDYFKEEQIQWSYEFLIDVLKLPKERLAVSVFEGNDDAPRDEFSASVWEKCGMPVSRIAYLGADDNWWAKGDTGPCGPDTEMFYWTGDEAAPESFQESHEDERWVEIWNDVFMQFNKLADGSLEPLPAQNVDTGMGLARTVAVLNGKKSVYETDAFTDILQVIGELSGQPELPQNPTGTTKAHNNMRIIADHVRSAVVLISDGVTPSNTDQGYILRRLIRRAVRCGKQLGIDQHFTTQVAQKCIDKLGPVYTNLVENAAQILTELQREEEQFATTLVKGEKVLEKLKPLIMRNLSTCQPARSTSSLAPAYDLSYDAKSVSQSCAKTLGEIAFDMYQTYGYPKEMTYEYVTEVMKEVDNERMDKRGELLIESSISMIDRSYMNHFNAHQAKSKAGAAQKFAGGLADDSEATTNLHTATHLLHAGLRKVLGEHVSQRGSNITAERLRFDFGHPEKVTAEQLAEVAQYVNDAIAADQAITCSEMPTDDAFASGALGFFGHKYPDVVKVYDMGEWSREICGGPHAPSTGVLGTFTIKKEQSASKGVRRIKAVLQ